IARKEDVCLHAVLANHWIVRLSMSKPTSVDAIKRALRDGLTVILERNIESLNYIIRNTIINDFSKSDGPNSVNKHNSQRLLKRPITINKSDPAESNNSFWSPTSFQKSEPQIIYAPSKIPETSEMISDKYKPIISFKKEEIDIEVSIQNTKKIHDIDQLSSNSFLESAIHKSNARKLQSLNNESIQEFDYISAKSKVYCSIPDSFGKSLRLMNEDRSFKNSSRKKAKRITSGKYTVFPKHESK
ncbi:MAG: hypothetical protein JNK41_03810, partial [Saprospiraceae bacterium]|nr:hypothetical protein [Saprospiraceae bacterium]